jgi:hypothetical protein
MSSNATSSRRSVRQSVTIAQEVLDVLPKNDVNRRLLKALLENAPTADGVEVIATDIIAASEEENGLVQLAGFYTTGLILPSEPPFDSNGFVTGLLIDTAGLLVRSSGRTPQVSFHPSRDIEIKSTAEDITVDLEAAKRDWATLKKYVSLNCLCP